MNVLVGCKVLIESFTVPVGIDVAPGRVPAAEIAYDKDFV